MTRHTSTPNRVVWSVTPGQTRSTYVRQLVPALRERGWQVDDLSLLDLARTERELVHIQWPEHVSRSPKQLQTLLKHARAAALLAVFKARNHRVVLTAHNLAPHNKHDAVDRWFRAQLFKAAAAVVVLVPEHEAELRDAGQIENEPMVSSIRHPIQMPSTPCVPLDSAESLMILGVVHPYHRILEFVDAMAAAGSTRKIMIVGGVADQDLADQLVSRSEEHQWIQMFGRYVSDAELEPLLAETAAIVSLQRDPFNSGGPFFALGHRIPVIMTESAQSRSLRSEIGDDWIFEVPVDESALDVGRLDAWLERTRAEPDTTPYEPDAVAAAHALLYETVSGR